MQEFDPPPVRIVNPGGPVPRGIDDFAEARTQSCCLVDKSRLIGDVLACDDKIMLITRPRRFGKTINMSMLRYFFEPPPEATNTCALFDGLLISEDTATMEHQGCYPVVSLTLKSAKLPTWEEAYGELCSLIHREITRHKECRDFQGKGLEPDEEASLERILSRVHATKADWCHSLELLCKLLALHYNKDNPDKLRWTHPIVLIDEYDAPIHAAYTNSRADGEELHAKDSYYGRMADFIRSLLGNALKGNRYLHKAVLTGILRVAKEDIFSGLNNPGIYGVLEDRFASSFGFTEPEVAALLTRRGLADRLDAVRAWYNGYCIGADKPVTIYNPWSVVSYLVNPTETPRPYWVNTSGNDLIRSMIEESGDPQDRADVETLLLGGVVEKEICDTLALRDLANLSDALWSILLTSGYLTVDHGASPLFGTRLRVPNREVQFVYRRLIAGWFRKSSTSHALPAVLKALAAGNVEQFARHLATFASGSLSIFDFAGPEPERVYHALVMGMLAYLSDTYHIRSNRESGSGRPDLLLIPNDPKRCGIIMEFKVVRAEDQLEQATQAALRQIRDKNYAAEFADRPCEAVLAVAVAFAGKRLATAHEWVR